MIVKVWYNGQRRRLRLEVRRSHLRVVPRPISPHRFDVLLPPSSLWQDPEWSAFLTVLNMPLVNSPSAPSVWYVTHVYESRTLRPREL
jgi:hypothetical protein